MKTENVPFAARKIPITYRLPKNRTVPTRRAVPILQAVRLPKNRPTPKAMAQAQERKAACRTFTAELRLSEF